jgi:glycosyltransferase involved in cell wall biosynthesis
VIAGWGDQPYEGQVRSLAAELGVARCLFAGPQFHDDRAATYRAADAFILPSVCEGLPMAALEAWSFGRPALMTEACNLPQGFRAGAALPLPPPARTEELAAAIRSALARGPDELGAAGERGAALARDEFAWPGVAARFAGLYGWIVRGGPAPACVTEA